MRLGPWRLALLLSVSLAACSSSSNSDVAEAGAIDAPIPEAASDAGPSDSVGEAIADSSSLDAPPTEVSASPCSDLPAAGTWESITPPGVSVTDAIVVDPFDASLVWVGTKDHGIFRSKGCGAPGTWVHVNTGTNGEKLDHGEPISVIADPKNAGVLYSTSFYGASGLWKSTNAGVDWTALFPPESEVAKVVEYNLVNSIGMDAHDTAHLVVSMHAHCAAPYGPVCIADSRDGGATWHIIHVPLPGVTDWIAGAGVFLLDVDSWLFSTYSNGLWLTDDAGSTWKNVTPAGATGSTSGKTIVVPFLPSAGGRYHLASMEGILSSVDGRAWSLLPASGGRSVGLAEGNGHIFSSDQWAPNYHVADDTASATWTEIAKPTTLASDQGAPYLAYDAPHHILYSSNWAGGLWRTIRP